MLHQRGLPIPAEALSRDTTVQHSPHPEIERAWGEVFAGGAYADLAELGDALLAIAEGYADYKHHHLLTSLRTYGNRPGYYGKPSGDWLKETIQELPFPELWSVRTDGDWSLPDVAGHPGLTDDISASPRRGLALIRCGHGVIGISSRAGPSKVTVLSGSVSPAYSGSSVARMSASLLPMGTR